MRVVYVEPLPKRAGPAEILALIEERTGLDRRRVGRIERRGPLAAIEVPADWVERLVRALDGGQFAGRTLRASDAESGAGRAEEDHFTHLARLLDLETRAEAERTRQRAARQTAAAAQASGTCLLNLVVSDDEAGLGGRVLVHLVRRDRRKLPWTRLDVGSPVVLAAAEGTSAAYRGVICERHAGGVCVALAELPDELGDVDVWRIDLADDLVAIQRQQAALARARAARGDRLAELRDVLLGRRAARFDAAAASAAPPASAASAAPPAAAAARRAAPLDEPLDRGLNATQRAAVDFALSARDVALVHGPPGTGKTRTLVELVARAVARGDRVLAVAPSNLAVDNLFERLLAAGIGAVRLGHPARVLPELRAHTLDLLVDEHPDVRLARRLVKEALDLFRRAGRYTRARPSPGARRNMRDEARGRLADARRLEAQAVRQILHSAEVLCATLTGLDDELLADRRFDLAVVDEACQSVEPSCWIALVRADRVVLAGDHCQLPPTVVSAEAAAGGLATSLFERLMSQDPARLSRRLDVQYRMHADIMGLASGEFYDGALVADLTVAAHLLRDLPGTSSDTLLDSPLTLIDTAGTGFQEELEPEGESRRNPQEAALVCRQVQALLAAGVAAADVAVIAPYAAQVRLLRERLPIEGLEIDSVDGFQGREKEAVVISLVRSSDTGEIGFLSDIRRMNVAWTRARRKLIVVGDSATLATHPFYARMIAYCEERGAYRTAWDEDFT